MQKVRCGDEGCVYVGALGREGGFDISVGGDSAQFLGALDDAVAGGRGGVAGGVQFQAVGEFFERRQVGIGDATAADEEETSGVCRHTECYRRSPERASIGCG